MKKAIVVGATSGIGKQLALLLANNNYIVGITGRREQLLTELRNINSDNFITAAFDVSEIETIPQQLEKLTSQLGSLDLLIMSSGTGEPNPLLNSDIEQQTNDVNVAGFTAVADWSFNFFESQKHGHFVAITSVAGIRGGRHSPAYNASKAYQINYLQGLRQRAANLKIQVYITDVRPGFVDTAMAKGEGLFWVAPVEKAIGQIYKAIENKRKVVYITKRWRLVACLIRLLPAAIYNKI